MRSLLALAVAVLTAFALPSCAEVDDGLGPTVGVAANHAAAEADTYTLAGSVLLPGGAPAAGARVQCWSMGVAGDLTDREQRADARGHFRFSFSPEATATLVLYVSYAGHGTLRSGHMAESRDLTIDPFRLSPAGAVVVRLVDSEGRVPPGEWIAALTTETNELDATPRPATRSRDVSADDGTARFDDLLPGTWRVVAMTRSSGLVRADEPAVVRAGETTTVEFLRDGPDTSRAIWVQTRTRPHPTRYRPTPDRFRLIGPGTQERTLPDDALQTRFVELPPGTYTATIDDPRFQPWSLADIEPGGSVVADLVARAGVRLTVVNAADGAPIEDYRVRVRIDDGADPPLEYTLLDADDAPPRDGVLRVLPDDQTLLVSAEGFGVTELPLRGMQPSEVRDLEAALERR